MEKILNNVRIRYKRDTSSNWTRNNPVLLNGEIILVDTAEGELRTKIGDGVKTYTQLPFNDEALKSLITTKVESLGAVKYLEQTLTTEQKMQARANIGAASEDEIPEAIVRYSSISILASNWTGTESPYTQTVTISDVTITTASKIDLQPTIEQYNDLYHLGTVLQAVNDNGTVTLYAVGNKPTSDYTMQISIVETINEDGNIGYVSSEDLNNAILNVESEISSLRDTTESHVTTEEMNDTTTLLDNRISSLETSVNGLLNEGVSETTFVGQNEQAKRNVVAAAKYGYHRNGLFNQDKRFTMLVTTDVHNDATRFQNAIDLLNYMGAFDCGICLGDIQGQSYSQANTWYTSTVNKSTKPFYTVLGNHDVGTYNTSHTAGTPAQAFTKFIKPTLSTMGMTSLTVPYYKATYDKYKVALICLNNYDAPLNKNSSGAYIIKRDAEAISQTQLDWFVNALKEIPSGYHLIVARHSYPGQITFVDSDWSKENPNLFRNLSVYQSDELVADIINAWINGTSITKTYAPLSTYSICPTLSVNVDFSSRGTGNFVCHLIGHLHVDLIAKSSVYKNQNIVAFTTTNGGEYQNSINDLPRDSATGTDNAITSLSIDTTKKKIHIVRVGSDTTFDMKKREYLTLDY